MRRRIALVVLASAAASGCVSGQQLDDTMNTVVAAPGVAYSAAQRAMGPPQFTSVSNPASLTGGQQQTMPQPAAAPYEAGAPNSLWRTGSRSFFNDQRASRIGDILTVEIEISDKAEVSNSSNRSRQGSSSAGVTHFFGLENAFGALFNSDFDPTQLIEAESESDHTGQGAINREEKIELTVAAVIVDRLPNGNLVISGRQQVRINGELRELTVAGVIRPEDISSDNRISHEEIAEARISYGGRGQISAVQRPNWGQRIGDAISPW